MLRPGDERVLLTVYNDHGVRETYATADMQEPGDGGQFLTVAGEHHPYGERPLRARDVLEGHAVDHRSVFAFGHVVGR